MLQTIRRQNIHSLQFEKKCKVVLVKLSVNNLQSSPVSNLWTEFLVQLASQELVYKEKKQGLQNYDSAQNGI